MDDARKSQITRGDELGINVREMTVSQAAEAITLAKRHKAALDVKKLEEDGYTPGETVIDPQGNERKLIRVDIHERRAMLRVTYLASNGQLWVSPASYKLKK